MGMRSILPPAVVGPGKATLKELGVGLATSALVASFAFVIGAVLAATLCAIGGVLWVLARGSYQPKDGPGDDPRVARRFVVPSKDARAWLSRAAGVFVVSGMLVALVSGVVGAVRTHRADEADRLRGARTAEGVEAIGRAQESMRDAIGQIAEDYRRRLETEEARGRRLTEHNARLERDSDELRSRLESALAALADQGVASGRPVEEVLDELRAGDPRSLLEFLDAQVRDEEAAYLAARDELILRHRERAALAYSLHEFEKAEQSLRRVLEVFPGDPSALTRLGLVHRSTGRFDQAEEMFLRVLEAPPDDGWRAAALGNLGAVSYLRGDFQNAHRLCLESLGVLEARGEDRDRAALLNILGLISLELGDPDEATRYHTRSLDMHRRIGDESGVATQLENLGEVERTWGDLDLAESRFQEALGIRESLDDPGGIARSRANLGNLAVDRGDLEEAVLLWRQALDYFDRVGMRPETLLLRQKIEQACELARLSIEMFEGVGMADRERAARERLERLGCD